MKFFQEITYPSISISANKDVIGFQRFNRNRSVWTRKAENLNLVFFNTYFNGFSNIICLMIYSIGKALFNCGIRLVEEAIGFSTIRVFYDLLLDH